MGVPNGPFDLELITRTKELISTYKGRYFNTLLMNSLLSLIVLPQQYNSRQRNLTFMNEELALIKQLDFILNSPNFHFDPRGYKNDLKNLLNRIRNGIAHQHIQVIGKNHKWDTIIIEDINKYGQVGLHLELSIKELKTLAFYIGDEYISAVQPPQTPVL